MDRMMIDEWLKDERKCILKIIQILQTSVCVFYF